MWKIVGLAVIISVGAFFLIGTDTAEERAQAHFESGMALLEKGDVDRALLEFRNVFQLDGFHRDARATYARVTEERGNVSEAYSQYLRLVEQYPDDLDGRKALARLAMTIGNLQDAETHGRVAIDLDPDNREIMAILSVIDYRNALRAQDTDGMASAVADARALVDADPDLINAHRVLIESQVRNQQWQAALDEIDAGLKVAPEDLVLHRLRLGVLEQLGLETETEAHLKAMTDLFPEDENIRVILINWYVSRGRIDDAEAYMRGRIDPDTAEDRDYTQLVAFLAQHRGTDVARAEIERILTETDADRVLFRSALARLDFEAGAQDAAIAEMEDILAGAEPSDRTRSVQVDLAKMLLRTGNPVGARAQVEEVLEADPTQVGALKLKSAWLIEDDLTGDAIFELRRALDQSPRDPEIMTLMASAYEREGNRDLLNEMLSLAVEASGGAPRETLRYAALLVSEDKLIPAEDVLVDALRLTPDHPDLLNALGRVYLQMEDWARLDHVIATLERVGSEQTLAMANDLTARKLSVQDRDQELAAFLGQLAEEDGDLQSIATFIRIRLANGDVEGALAYVTEQRAQDPDNPALRFIEGGVLAVKGDVEAAEKIFRELLADGQSPEGVRIALSGLLQANGDPDAATAILQEGLAETPGSENMRIALYRLLRTNGDAEAAKAVLAKGLEEAPSSGSLLFTMAGELESQGDLAGAIEIYEVLYDRNSSSLVVANNLASLLSMTVSDEDTATLERAFTIARRLRGTQVPAFQDTYGWIAHRLGNHEEAVEYLKPAAESKDLGNEPLVKFHLAQVYIALDRSAEALALLETAADLIETTGRRTEIAEKVQSQIAMLKAERPADN